MNKLSRSTAQYLRRQLLLDWISFYKVAIDLHVKIDPSLPIEKILSQASKTACLIQEEIGFYGNALWDLPEKELLRISSAHQFHDESEEDFL